MPQQQQDFVGFMAGLRVVVAHGRHDRAGNSYTRSTRCGNVIPMLPPSRGSVKVPWGIVRETTLSLRLL